MVWQLLYHENICPFLGVSFDAFYPRPAIVTLWMDNGDLPKYLGDNPKVDKQAMVRSTTLKPVV